MHRLSASFVLAYHGCHRTTAEQILRGADFKQSDCAVIRRLHTLIAHEGGELVQTVKGIFTEGGPVYPNAGIYAKTHVQIAVRDRRCIKGVFRVPKDHLQLA
jgi:hypothetical protein